MIEIVATVIGLGVLFGILWLYGRLDRACRKRFKIPFLDLFLAAVLIVLLAGVAGAAFWLYVIAP